MKAPLFAKATARNRERGITMVLVAVAMVAIVAVAALSIDVITLYLAKEEAQRAADNAALAAAQIIAVSGITGDPANSTLNWSGICGGSTSAATMRAQAVAQQNDVSGIAAASVVVTYSGGAGGGSLTSDPNCTHLNSTAFGVNPLVTVKVTTGSLPSFFSRIWGNPGKILTASATAEAFNPSNSGNEGNQTTGTLIPVQPRCAKPWIVPNQDPGNGTCTGPNGCPAFVGLTDGSIQHPGISLNGTANTGVIGEKFWLIPDCQNNPTKCMIIDTPQANYPAGGFVSASVSPPNLFYVPNQVGATPIAISSCNNGNTYNRDIAGCDQATNYQCGVKDANVADLTIGPVTDTTDGVACLIHQGDTATVTASTGQDYLNATAFGAPSAYPFQILAGSANPVVGSGLSSGTPVTISSSIVSLPIYDQTEPGVNLSTNNATPVTFVGFLQVFINAVDATGDVLVTVLNVAGCSNNATAPPIAGSSPLPVRLITPP